jgi:hypothetical protein
MAGQSRRIFVEMLREEWRLHSRLFSGRRFGLFPALIAVFVAGSVEVLVVTGTDFGTIFAGLHALVFVFGLHTGSIGFVGRDAVQNLLGDVTLLVFSARTLPLSQRRLLGLFLVKDVVYYALLFLIPMAVGVLPSAVGSLTFTTGEAVGTVLLLWVTLTGTFVLGLGTTIAGLGLTGRGRWGQAAFAALVAGGVGVWISDISLVAATPYGAFRSLTPMRVGAVLALVAAVLVLGAVTFETTTRNAVRTVGPSIRRWGERVDDPVATKTLLDVHRSSGGFGKVLFSSGILFGVTAVLVDLAGQITGVSPSVGVSFGTILGLSGFTTYNWLTQFDDVDSYLAHPLAVSDIFRAKFSAFLLLGPLVGLGYYLLALLWHGSRPLDAIVGAVVLVGVACYIFGVTVYLTGLSPNEFLFDTLLFAVFGVAVVVALVPVLIVGFALAPVSEPLLAALFAGGLVLGSIGVALYRLAVPKWTARYRQ